MRGGAYGTLDSGTGLRTATVTEGAGVQFDLM
jgi:hypothetical protein